MTWERLRQQLPKTYSPQDVELVHRAYELAERAHGDQKRKSGEPYIIHPLAVAGILAELRLDAQTVAAALAPRRGRRHLHPRSPTWPRSSGPRWPAWSTA